MMLIIVAPIIVLDQLTKYLITRFLEVGQSIPVVRNIFHLTLVHNRGAAFGMLKNQVPLFIATAVFTVLLIYRNLKGQRHKRLSLYQISLCFILAGAVGNLIDRVSFGYVIDFLDFRVWPVFNIADSVITVGAGGLALSILRESK